MACIECVKGLMSAWLQGGGFAGPAAAEEEATASNDLWHSWACGPHRIAFWGFQGTAAHEGGLLIST